MKSERTMVFLLLLTFNFLLFTSVFADEKWQGVDEAVVEKYAKEHGREAKGLLINTDQGDLLLFVFLLAGTIGGFAAGYYWRILIVEREPGMGKDEREITGDKSEAGLGDKSRGRS